MNDNLTYINILINTLHNKNKILDDIILMTEKQDKLASEQQLDVDAFEKLLEDKGELIEALEEIDKGFDSVFEKVREELKDNKDNYTDEIKELQALITELTDKSVKIQVSESRNKTKMGVQFSKAKKEIKSFKTNNQVTNSYKNSMANGQSGESYFLDKKK